MRDHRRDVEAGLHHHRHLVPGLVHLAAVDALQRQHVEDDRGEVDRHLAGLDPEQRDPAAVGHRRQQAAQGGRPGPTSRARRRSPRSSRARPGSRRGPSGRGVDRRRRPHPQRQLAPVGVRVGDDDVTARPRDGRPRPPCSRSGRRPVTSTSSPSTGNVSAVWTALPNGSKIAADVLGDPGPVVPDVRHRQRDVLGECAGPLHAEPDRVRAQVPPPRHAVAAATADDVPLAADDVARVEVAHVRADLDDLARRTRARSRAARGSSSAPRRPTSGCAGRCRRCRSCAPG